MGASGAAHVLCCWGCVAATAVTAGKPQSMLCPGHPRTGKPRLRWAVFKAPHLAVFYFLLIYPEFRAYVYMCVHACAYTHMHHILARAHSTGRFRI